jgi:hypothetical protein
MDRQHKMGEEIKNQIYIYINLIDQRRMHDCILNYGIPKLIET